MDPITVKTWAEVGRQLNMLATDNNLAEMRPQYPELEEMPPATLDMKIGDKFVFKARPVGADRYYADALKLTGLVDRYPDEGNTDKTIVFKNALVKPSFNGRMKLNLQNMKDYVYVPPQMPSKHSQSNK